MADETYNGWKNYPTWVMNLWLSNDASTSEQVTWIVQDGMSSELPLFDVEEKLKSYSLDRFGEENDEFSQAANFATDLFRYAFELIDFREIVENWASELGGVIDDNYNLVHVHEFGEIGDSGERFCTYCDQAESETTEDAK